MRDKVLGEYFESRKKPRNTGLSKGQQSSTAFPEAPTAPPPHTSNWKPLLSNEFWLQVVGCGCGCGCGGWVRRAPHCSALAPCSEAIAPMSLPVLHSPWQALPSPEGGRWRGVRGLGLGSGRWAGGQPWRRTWSWGACGREPRNTHFGIRKLEEAERLGETLES